MAVSISREMLTLFTNDVVVAVDQVTIFVVLDVRWSLFVFFLRQQQLQTPTKQTRTPVTVRTERQSFPDSFSSCSYCIQVQTASSCISRRD